MLNAASQALIESATLAHLVTINKNGPPRTVAWVGLKGGEPVPAHLAERPKKLRTAVEPASCRPRSRPGATTPVGCALRGCPCPGRDHEGARARGVRAAHAWRYVGPGTR